MDPYYIVVLDKEIGYCRLFRTDSEKCPAMAEPLWQGHNLDVGYEEMIRHNQERQLIPSYHVSHRMSEKGRKIYKIFKENPTSPWTSLDLFHDYKLAVAKLKELCAAREAFTEEVQYRKKIFMHRLQMKGKSLRLDAAGKKYVEWLINSGKLSSEEKENIQWLKENGVLRLTHP